MPDSQGRSGFFVSEAELKRIFDSNRHLSELSRAELVAGVVELNFRGAKIYEYLISKESLATKAVTQLLTHRLPGTKGLPRGDKLSLTKPRGWLVGPWGLEPQTSTVSICRAHCY